MKPLVTKFELSSLLDGRNSATFENDYLLSTKHFKQDYLSSTNSYINQLTRITPFGFPSMSNVKVQDTDGYSPPYRLPLNYVGGQPFLNAISSHIYGNPAYDYSRISWFIWVGALESMPCPYDMQWMPFMPYRGFPPVTGWCDYWWVCDPKPEGYTMLNTDYQRDHDCHWRTQFFAVAISEISILTSRGL
jgi:hypothetical protein